MLSLNPLRALSDAQIEQYRDAGERLLEETGFCVRHEGLLQRARASGARVEETSGRVRLPAPFLRDLLAQAPRAYTIRKIAGAIAPIDLAGGSYEVGAESPGFFAITNDPWIIDYDAHEPRRPCLDDVRRNTILAQELDSVVCVSCMDYPVTDCDDDTSSWRALEVHLHHHAKHNAVLPASREKFREWLDIAAILNRGEDLQGSRMLTCGVAVKSPLMLTEPNGDLLLEACAHGFPVVPTICPMAGATSPYTLASTLLVAHAETLFMAALTQLVRPGHPFQYGVGPSVCDMRSAEDRYYTLDKVLWKVACVQLAKAYGLPCGAECGGTMPPRFDLQSGAEGMLFMLAAYASGADLLCGLGSCYNANGLSAELMIVQQAWLDAARFLARGIETDAHHFGFENIAQAGPGADFLTDPLTLEFCRGGEFFENAMFDYDGGKSMLERAHERVEDLIGGYQCPVPHDIQEELNRYFHDFYKNAGS